MRLALAERILADGRLDAEIDRRWIVGEDDSLDALRWAADRAGALLAELERAGSFGEEELAAMAGGLDALWDEIDAIALHEADEAAGIVRVAAVPGMERPQARAAPPPKQQQKPQGFKPGQRSPA